MRTTMAFGWQWASKKHLDIPRMGGMISVLAEGYRGGGEVSYEVNLFDP